MFDLVVNKLTSIYDTVVNFFKSIYQFISDFIDWFINFIKDFWESVYDFVVDLIPNFISLLVDFLQYLFTDLLPSACEYCFGGWDIVFTNNLQLLLAVPDSFGATTIYILQKVGFDDALRRLSYGVLIWFVFRIVSLIRG